MPENLHTCGSCVNRDPPRLCPECVPAQVSRSVGDDRQGGESKENQDRSADVHEHDRCPGRGRGIAAQQARDTGQPSMGVELAFTNAF